MDRQDGQDKSVLTSEGAKELRYTEVYARVLRVRR